MGVKKKLQLTSLLGLSLFIMTACATNGTASDITADSTDFWSKFVYFFAEIIRFLSFDISIGVGIILFTILIRTILLPVFQTQMVASIGGCESRSIQQVSQNPHLDSPLGWSLDHFPDSSCTKRKYLLLRLCRLTSQL